MSKAIYLIFGILNSSGSVMDAMILVVPSPKSFTSFLVFFFLNGQNFQKNQYKHQIATVTHKNLKRAWKNNP